MEKLNAMYSQVKAVKEGDLTASNNLMISEIDGVVVMMFREHKNTETEKGNYNLVKTGGFRTWGKYNLNLHVWTRKPQAPKEGKTSFSFME